MKSELDIDLAGFLEAVGGDESTAVELIDLFLLQTDNELQKLDQAIMNQDASQIAAVSHKCAGSSISCGMPGLAREFKELELAAKVGFPADSIPRMTSIRYAYRSARDACIARFNRDFNP